MDLKEALKHLDAIILNPYHHLTDKAVEALKVIRDELIRQMNSDTPNSTT